VHFLGKDRSELKVEIPHIIPNQKKAPAANEYQTVGSGSVQKSSKFFVSHMEESMTEHVGLFGIY
jgi:hypothetical protein